ncbi:MAG: hypothetical protein ABSF98_07020 [Bryobacteraceae bacterium]|jgi:hypothetical protein
MSNCAEWTSRLVDNARAGVAPSPGLREHLSGCPSCAGRWRNERVLTREMQILSDRAARHRPPQRGLDLVMREFERQRWASRWHWLRWVPAPAAALLVLVALLGIRHRDGVTPMPRTVAMAAVPTEPSEEGFVDVPYAPPLAPGEFVSVVREELEPAALVRMGLPVNGIGDAPVVADVVVGEDGFPRAVRVADETVSEF